MDEYIMKLIDRLVAAERMNAIYEMRQKRLMDLIFDTERAQAEYKRDNPSYSRYDSIDNVNITTAEVRKAAGIESERSTVELFRQLDKIGEEEEE